MQAVLALVLASLAISSAIPALRTAPEECPVQNGNLLDTILFVTNSTECRDRCSAHDQCLFFFYYQGSGSNAIDATNQPPQCFLYDTCSRKVMKASESCPLNRENTVAVRAFVRNDRECEKSCTMNDLCGHYKHFSSDDPNQPLMCYHLKSCSKRVIRNQECPIEKNNYIDHTLFNKDNEECMSKCEDTPGCRYYYWYPIDYSPAPQYCYLFRSCEGGAAEPQIALLAAGRHPGHYFVGQNEVESMDIVRYSTVCGETVEGDTVAEIGRAGAVAEYARRRVLLCGGRDHEGSIRSDCQSYHPREHTWEEHSNLREAREEAASVTVDGAMYIFGGFVEGQRASSSERLGRESEEEEEGSATWFTGPEMPEARSRFCAVALDNNVLAVIGGETEEAMATPTMKTYDVENEEWITQPEMAQNRKDHACLVIEIDGKKGILVTGGVDENDILLDSAEFYNIEEETWVEMGKMQHGRTEHGMANVGGRANVFGGVSDDEFLASIEVLDNSANDDAPMGMEFGIVAHAISRPRYDFIVAQIPISAMAVNERNLDKCLDESEVVSSAFIK